ncbi:SidA/IucD/PvdA family monooxygenase [Rugamonas sp. FT82W]|uniref:SidA/IucD/PvdA family monooxygenase n=1 Tax=Duganella vulcania TaxID=2692166 RepID=A0A845G3C2_9BURK|nr:SidA/IucD/PvdA family monooxygenase [Duganella vulcania]MYM88140.1 SidA/IucD/PvdA family monooxygenase [Duganella vulcania]
MYTEPNTYDILGVGFGPSNLALAIALDEILPERGRELSHCFIERQAQFTWHGDMLLPGTDMQISFLKDLVSLRDPTSPYSFVNYLRQHNRLEAFINQKTFFPSRIEFNDYLRWTAGHFDAHCRYGESVTRVVPEYKGREVVALTVHSADAAGRERRRRTRSLVFAPGGRPFVPPCLAERNDARIIHSSRYLGEIERNPLGAEGRHALAVVGGGQSAAEIFLDLVARYPNAKVDLILRGSTLKPSEDGPSINHIFDPDYTDFFFGQPQKVRQSLLAEFRHTNYAVVDGDLIERISAMLYAQRVEGTERVRVLSSCAIEQVQCDEHGVTLNLAQAGAEQPFQQRYQRVISATGYLRDTSRSLLAELEHELDGFSIGRHYQLAAPAHVQTPIFVQGSSETTHGLADTLLSVLAIRSHEIALSLVSRLAPKPQRPVHANDVATEEVE